MLTKRDFEVIVVGGGPAGVMAANLLSEKKFRVALFEKEFEIGYPNKSSAGTPMDTFETFNLPKEVAYTDIYGFRFFGPTKVGAVSSDKILGRVFKFRELKQYLIKEAIKAGCVVFPGTEVTDFIRKDQKTVGVTYKGYSFNGKAFSNVVVDASGPKGFFATKLGLWKKDDKKLGVAFEYFLKGANPDKCNKGYYLDLFVGETVAPGGYAWIFPTSHDEAKAGICKLKPTFKTKNEKSQIEYFHELWEKDPQIKGSQPFEVHDCSHYITGGERHGVLDNFVAIGDAVNKVNPLFGEGIRASFYSAKFACEAIENARKKNNFSESTLRMYDDLWQKNMGANWMFTKWMFEILYSSDDKGLDLLLTVFEKFDVKTLYNLYVGKAEKKDYLNFLKSIPHAVNPKLMFSLAKNLL